MNTDTQIRDDVERELFYAEGADSASIGVAVEDAVVTLTGAVETYERKVAAVHAAERVRSVKSVACELEVRLPGPKEKTDTDLARSVANALAWNTSIPSNRVRIAVANGWVTLEGTVDTPYQREAVSKTVAQLTNVKGIVNLIGVDPLVACENCKERIESALRHNGSINPRNVLVEVDGDRVSLYGDVHSMPERDEVERIAWSAPGISDVANHLLIVAAAPETQQKKDLWPAGS